MTALPRGARAPLLALAVAAGCARGGAARGPAAGPAAAAAAGPAGEPPWVRRGSAAVGGGGGRAFYGVGMASGIKGAALLRGTAENRARAELARVLATFTRSLMHDTAASDDTQQVEQAIDTLASGTQQGVQIVDRYSAADGSLYALASLDEAAVAPALEAARQKGLVRTDVHPVTVDDIFDAHLPAAAARPAAVAVAAADAGAGGAGDGAADGHRGAPESLTRDAAAERHGAPPAWVGGDDPRFPSAEMLCAVGTAPARPAAEDAGYAALSRLFGAQVSAASRDFLGAYSKTGAPDLQVQSSEQLTTVTTATVLQGVRVVEVYRGADGVYALACLERDRGASLLRGQIADLDHRAGLAMAAAGRADPAARVQMLGRAVEVLVQREATNTQLRLVDPHGVGVAGAFSPADVAATLEQAVAALRVGVRVDGPRAEALRPALLEGLAGRGYQPLAVAPGDGAAAGALDVLVTASVRLEDAGGAVAGVSFARAVVAVDARNVATGRVFAAFSESRKEGAGSPEEAERRAVANLAAKIVADVGAKIDAAMRDAGP